MSTQKTDHYTKNKWHDWEKLGKKCLHWPCASLSLWGKSHRNSKCMKIYIFLLKFLASLTSSFNNWSTFKWKYDAVDNLEDVCNCALALNSDSIRRNAYVEGWIGTWILRQILEAIYAGRSKILTFTCKQMSASLMMRGFEIVNVHLQQFQDEHWIGREWIRRVVPL